MYDLLMIIVSRLSRFYNHWKPKSKPKLKFDSSHIPTAVELFFYCITTHERHMIETHDTIWPVSTVI